MLIEKLAVSHRSLEFKLYSQSSSCGDLDHHGGTIQPCPQYGGMVGLLLWMDPPMRLGVTACST